jgi:cobalt-zinc-cadmium efflux system outer membrane protein
MSVSPRPPRLNSAFSNPSDSCPFVSIRGSTPVGSGSAPSPSNDPKSLKRGEREERGGNSKSISPRTPRPPRLISDPSGPPYSRLFASIRDSTPVGSSCFASVAISALASLTAFLAGCATPQVDAPSLTAESGAARFEARSLSDPALRQFLRDNLGHEPATWDFESLCWVGFYYHPSLELARAQWSTARAAQRTAGQKQNPTLTLSPGYDFTRQAGVSPWMPSLSMDFLLSTAGKRNRQEAVARADAEVARLGIVTAAWQMRSELRKALADATTAVRRENALRVQADAQRRVLALLEQRFSAGAVAASDLAATRSAWLRAEAAAADAAIQAATARARVAAALGLSASAIAGVTLPEPTVPPAFSPEALAEVRRQSLRSRADVLAALAKYQSAQAALELELAKQTPDIHLGPGYQWDQGQNKWSLGISFEFPVFHRNEGPIAEAVARRAEAAAQFNVVQGQTIAAIDAAIAAMQGAAAQLDRAHRLQDEVARQTSLAQQRRELGSADELEVASTRLDQAMTESTLLDAEIAAKTAAGQLEDALQVPFANLAALTVPPKELAKPESHK